MIRSFLAKGHQKFSQGEFLKAATSFQRAMERANGMKQSNFILSELTHARLKIGLACIHEGKLEESEEIFSVIIDDDSPEVESCIHEVDAVYILARLLLHNNRLDAAEKYCKRASSSRKRIFGDRHPFYFVTIRLFAEIYKARGLFEDSSVCLDLIPNSSLLPEDLPEIHSYRSEASALLKGQGFDLDSPQFDTDSALLWAAAEGHEPVVRYLLIDGAFVKAMSTGETALHLAASKGQEAIVRLLLASKVNIKAVDDIGRTVLHVAAKCAKEGLVRLLLKSNMDIEATDNVGRTALQYSASNGNFAITQLLLFRGADIGATDCRKMTALHRAAYHGHATIVKVLLKHNADIDAVAYNTETPLHMAVRNGHENVVQLLLERAADVNAGRAKNQSTPLHRAAEKGNENVIQLLLDKGADVNSADVSLSTPLHLSAFNGHETVTRLLLEKGAYVTSKNNYLLTPLHLAASAGHENVTRFFLETGMKTWYDCFWTKGHIFRL